MEMMKHVIIVLIKIAALTFKNEVSNANYSTIKIKCISGH